MPQEVQLSEAIRCICISASRTRTVLASHHRHAVDGRAGRDPSARRSRSIRSHCENHDAGSMRALSVVKKRLAQAAGDKDRPASVYTNLQRERLLRTVQSCCMSSYLYVGDAGQAGAAQRQAVAPLCRCVGERVPPHRRWPHRRLGLRVACGSARSTDDDRVATHHGCRQQQESAEWPAVPK